MEKKTKVSGGGDRTQGLWERIRVLLEHLFRIFFLGGAGLGGGPRFDGKD